MGRGGEFLSVGVVIIFPPPVMHRMTPPPPEPPTQTLFAWGPVWRWVFGCGDVRVLSVPVIPAQAGIGSIKFVSQIV